MGARGSEETVDIELLAKTLNAHGTPLLQELASHSASVCQQLLEAKNLDPLALKRRPSHVDRLQENVLSKLKPFIASNVHQLFAKHTAASTSITDSKVSTDLPTLESFLEDLSARQEREKFFQDVRPSHIICCCVRASDQSGVVVKLLCVQHPFNRDLESLGIQVFIPFDQLLGPDQKEQSFTEGELLRVVVKAVSIDPELLTLSLLGEHCPGLGKITAEQLPQCYRATEQKRSSDSYDYCLGHSNAFQNPTVDTLLCEQLGLNIGGPVSFLNRIKRTNFGASELASNVRQEQSHRMALKSVVRGIEQFRAGNSTEALQHYNKALQVDANNIDALVARGALYANAESYRMAVNDFEAALNLDKDHKNASKYMVETCMAEAKLHESDSKKSRARRCYERILKWQPDHQEASEKLKRLQKKSSKKHRRRSGKSESSDSSVVSLSPDHPSSSTHKQTTATNGNEQSEDALQRQLREYYDKYKRSESTDELLNSGQNDSALLDRLKVYYDKYQKDWSKSKKASGSDSEESVIVVEQNPAVRRSAEKRRSSERRKSPAKMQRRESARGETKREEVERPEVSRGDTNKEVKRGESYRGDTNREEIKRPEIDTKKIKEKEKTEKELNKNLAKMENFITMLKKKADK